MQKTDAEFVTSVLQPFAAVLPAVDDEKCFGLSGLHDGRAQRILDDIRGLVCVELGVDHKACRVVDLSCEKCLLQSALRTDGQIRAVFDVALISAPRNCF